MFGVKDILIINVDGIRYGNKRVPTNNIKFVVI